MREPEADSSDGGSGGWPPVIPIPAELVESVVAAVSDRASALRKEASAKRAWDEYVQTGWESAEDSDVHDRLYQALCAASDRSHESWQPVSDSLSEVEEHLTESAYQNDENADWAEEQMEAYRRACAAATSRSGDYAVVISDATDPEGLLAPEDWDFAEETVAPYLVGRLGYTDDGAATAVTRIRHVSPETVLDGVDLNDAVRVKLELIDLGCKADVVEPKRRG